MNIDQVCLLIDLAQTHSFTHTAERHFTTQQGVSYQVKQLEQELQTKIFHRSINGVEFTQQGERVLQCAYEMERAYREMVESLKIKQENGQQIKKLKFCISSVLLSVNMTTVIKAFNTKFPLIKLIIKEITQDELMNELLSCECDFAFGSINRGYFNLDKCAENGLQSTLIQEDAAVAIVARKSPLAAKDKLSLEDLSQKPKSVYGMHPVDYFQKNLDAFVLYENNNIDIHKQLILEEDVICFTTEMIYRQLFSEDVFVAKAFNYPTLPVEHVVLKGSSQFEKEFQLLEHIIARIFTVK